ncbi:MAG: copper-containing nitrite reductase [Halobacterium sp.]
MFDTTRRRVLQGLGLGGTAAVAGCTAPSGESPATETVQDGQAAQKQRETVDRVAADPADVPDPVDWSSPKHHEVELTAKEVTAEIEPGVTFDFMTFDGRVPGPMIRVRRGDTISFTLQSADGNSMPHNVDFHAVYGTGGGAEATAVNPGESNGVDFTAKYPGAFIYHCAVPNMDMHISSGMFGMILVEPEDGLPEVDREFYLGQHEVYTDKDAGTEGHHKFDMNAMANEDPTYVLFNGAKYPFTPDRYGRMQAESGDSIRVYMVMGGPNLSSNFHPIGNVWTQAHRDGSLGTPEEYVQTMKVPPGSCMIGEMDTPVPETIKLVDHALSRVTRKGLLAEIEVAGEPDEDIFDPEPGE